MSVPVWTAERVKEELPAVTVKSLHSGHVSAGTVAGRKLGYARVTVDSKVLRYPYFEFSWETIARCLNEGRDLLV